MQLTSLTLNPILKIRPVIHCCDNLNPKSKGIHVYDPVTGEQ